MNPEQPKEGDAKKITVGEKRELRYGGGYCIVDRVEQWENGKDDDTDIISVTQYDNDQRPLGHKMYSRKDFLELKKI